MLIKKKKNQGDGKNFIKMVVYVADSGIFAFAWNCPNSVIGIIDKARMQFC